MSEIKAELDKMPNHSITWTNCALPLTFFQNLALKFLFIIFLTALFPIISDNMQQKAFQIGKLNIWKFAILAAKGKSVAVCLEHRKRFSEVWRLFSLSFPVVKV